MKWEKNLKMYTKFSILIHMYFKSKRKINQEEDKKNWKEVFRD